MRSLSELGLDALGVLNESPAVTYVVAIDDGPALVFVSRSVTGILGFEPEHFADQPGFLTSLIHPDDTASLRGTFEAALRDGAATADRRMRLASGEWRWFRDQFRIVRSSEGRAIYGIGTIFDVDSEKRAQERLEASRAEFSVLAEHSQDLISRITFDGRFIYQSPSTKRMMGFEAGARRDEFVMAHVHGDDYGAIETAWRAALKTRTAQRCSYRALHAEGKWVCLEAVVNPVVDPETNQVTEFVVVSRDISERIEAEQRLAEARRTIEEQSEIYGLFDRHGSDFFIRLSAEGVVTYVSPSHQRIIGRQEPMRPGTRLAALVHPDDRPSAMAAWSDAIAQQMSKVFRARIQHEDGRWIWLETEVTPVLTMIGEERHIIREMIALSRDVTGQIEADEALAIARTRIREQSELYHLFASQGSEIFLRFATDGRLTHVSPSHVRILGQGTILADETIGSRIHPDDIDTARAEFRAAAMTGQPRQYRHRYRHANGHWVWFEVSVTPVLSPLDGALMEYIAIARDVDEQVRREAQLTAARSELDESRARLRLVTDNIADIVTLFRPDGSVAYMSPSVAKVIGYTQDELSQLGSASIIVPEDQERVRAEVTRNRIGHITPQMRYRAWHKDGRLLWLDRRASEVHDHDFGDGVAVLSVIRDVTSDVEHDRVLEEAKAALEVGRAQLESIINNSIDVIAVFDAERRMRYVSKSCEQQSGYTVEEFLAGTVNLVHPEDEAAVDQALERESRDGEGEAFTYRGVRKDGEVIWLERRARKVYDPMSGALRNIVVVTRDISEEHRHREEMAAAHAQLERSKIAAETANVAKSQFLATMSHELRTPMTGVMGMLDLLKGSSLDVEQTRYADLAYQSAENLLAILNDILDFSKIEAGQLNVEMAPFALRKEIDQLSALLTPIAHKRGNTLMVRVEESVPDGILGDAMRIRQVLFNLVGNAIKFTQEGLVRVDVGQTPARRLRFEVRDTGLGIPTSAQDKLFRPFVQADGSSRRKVGGTGLGLAISKSLVEAMDGAIGFDSVEGKGALFWFELPLRPARAPECAAPAVLAPTSPVRRSFDVLVAEDHPVNQQLITAILRRERHRVTVVANGREAVDAVQTGRYDLVLMDVQMPVLDGVGATRAIRALPSPVSAIPIVAITANAQRGDREAYLAAGMTGYISKPIRIEALREAMEQAVPMPDRQRSVG